MTLNLLLQYGVLSLILLASVIQVLRTLLPQPMGKLQQGLARALQGSRWPSLLQKLGQWLEPQASAGHCGDGCSSCGGCGSSKPAAAVQFARLVRGPRR